MDAGACVLVAPSESCLRQEANYWRAQHARARQREDFWKNLAAQEKRIREELESTTEKLKKELGQRDTALAQKDEQIEALKARIVWLSKRLFGASTERSSTPSPGEDSPKNLETHTSPVEPASSSETQNPTGQHPKSPKRRRGQQPRAKGHGRRVQVCLPCVQTIHELPKGNRCCPKCGRPYVPTSTEDSEEIEWVVRVFRRRHRRKRYAQSCACEGVPQILTAPPPAKLIPKGMFSCSFWTRVLLEKYLFQRPMHRILHVLALEGLDLSQGTITGGLQRVGIFLQPLYTRIQERSRQANFRKMDETRWKVFVEIEGKKGYLWWLWVVITKDTVVFLLEPNRSAEVPRRHLGEHPEGIVLADRYCVYKMLGLIVAFCWAHIRRDFVRIYDAYEPLRGWADEWVQRINKLFELNRERRKALGLPEEFSLRDQEVRQAVAAMAAVRDRELANPWLPKVAKKALKSLLQHWEGATVFVANPQIEMDNNESERELRNPATGRKNYYGCGALWSGTLMVACFTIFQTLLKNQVDPQKWLMAYFEACAQNGGKPPSDLDAFLPWNLSEERRRAWKYPREQAYFR
jgi:transposase